MARPDDEPEERTYPLRTAARLTGLSPELLRAWERRYGVVEPIRTPGGTRRYTAEDLDRLRLVKAAVDGGERISRVAKLDLAELERRAAEPAAVPTRARLDHLLEALEALDAVELQRLLSVQLAALGPVRFAREVAGPLAQEIGDRWADDRLSVASEHLASSALRSLLGAALQPSAVALLGPRVVFGTPPDERHELGLLMAALTALGAGATPIYMGPDLPLDDLVGAAERTRARAVAVSIASLEPAPAQRALGELRERLDPRVELYVGGAGASGLTPTAGVELIETLDAFEQRVALLVSDGGRG